jgi:transcriptional regulator with XRE-family HTH domain
MLCSMAMSADQSRFIEWLLCPKDERIPSTQTQLAEEMGLSPSALSAWKNNLEFLKAWDHQYLQTIGSPDTKMRIMQTLMNTATDADDPKHVQAAKTFFEIEGSLRPTKTQVDVNLHGVKPSELSDEQLDELLRGKAGDELAQRREAS